MKLKKEDLAVVREMYSQAGKEEHFTKNIEPHIKSQEDLNDLVANSFGDKNTRSQFDGTLTQNEFVEQFYNIYRQRVMQLLKGKIPYIEAFLKEAPFSGSQGYISQNIKPGKEFTHIFTESTFNPTKRNAYLQVISTSIRRQYDDQLSITVIGRAASQEGGLNKYIGERIALLNEDFIAEIREAILTVIDAVKGKEITISVPVELQAVAAKQLRARYIVQEIIKELLYIKDNSTDYSDNGFATRTPRTELVGVISREAKAEIDVQAFGMFRNEKAMEGMQVGNMVDVPVEGMAEPFYIKFMAPEKIHYSNSVSVSGVDIINKNMKAVYSKTIWTELDVVDTEPALTVKVVDAAKTAKNTDTKAVVLKIDERVKQAQKRRENMYGELAKIYGKKSVAKAPKATIKDAEDVE